MKLLKSIKIDRKLLPIKAHYFFYNAGTAPVVPFLTTYATQLGFSPAVIGVIYTVLPISGLLAKPTFGSIADYFKCQKLIFLLSILVAAAAFLSINFAPQITLQEDVRFTCDSNGARFDTSPSNTTVDDCQIEQIKSDNNLIKCRLDCPFEEQDWTTITNCWNVPENSGRFRFDALVNRSQTSKINDTLQLAVENAIYNGQSINQTSCNTSGISSICSTECDDYNLNDLLTKPSLDDDELYRQSQFWVFFILMIAAWVGQAVIVSVGDAICFTMLEDKPHKYGRQRMFGALSYGIIGVIAGFMVDALSEGSAKKRYDSVFYLSFAMLLTDFVISTRIKHTQQKQSKHIIRDLGRLLKKFRVVVFFLYLIVMGLCTSLLWNFLFILIEDLANAQGCSSYQWIKTLQGLVTGTETLLGELPMYFFSGKIINKLGHANAMTLSLGVTGLRLVLYSLIPNPWWFLPLEITSGFFGLFYACMTSYASIVAPPGTEATMQGTVGAIFEGVGVSLGSFMAGRMYSEIGGVLTYRYFGIGALIMFVIHGIVQYLIRRADLSKINAEVKS